MPSAPMARTRTKYAPPGTSFTVSVVAGLPVLRRARLASVLAEPASMRKLVMASASGSQSRRTVVPVTVDRRLPGAAVTIPTPTSGTAVALEPQSTRGRSNDHPPVAAAFGSACMHSHDNARGVYCAAGDGLVGPRPLSAQL